jgi:hypothetical protein
MRRHIFRPVFHQNLQMLIVLGQEEMAARG